MSVLKDFDVKGKMLREMLREKEISITLKLKNSYL